MGGIPVTARAIAVACSIVASAWISSCGGPAGSTPPPEQPLQQGGPAQASNPDVQDGEDPMISPPPMETGPTEPGSAPCAGQHTGTWIGITVEDTMFLKPHCEFDYLGPEGSCTSKGRYEEPFGPSGSVGVIIESSQGTGCLPAGDYECTYALDGDTLTFDCGSGGFSYKRER